MKFGFIGFGEVSYTLSKILLSYGFEVLTSTEGRSKKTKELVKSLDLDVLDSFEEVAHQSDILISANSPQSALAVALKYGSLTDGIFLDFNNISPNTAKQIENYLTSEHFIDSAIMGRVSSEDLNLFERYRTKCLTALKGEEFAETVSEWGKAAGVEDAGKFLIVGVIGLNFVIELAINLVLSTVIVKLVGLGKKENR